MTHRRGVAGGHGLSGCPVTIRLMGGGEFGARLYSMHMGSMEARNVFQESPGCVVAPA